MKELQHYTRAMLKPSHQRHYAVEIERTLEAFNTPQTFNRPKAKPNNFISPRHDDNFNDFERDWIPALEEIH